jgi:putative FmdB family regulatory protein
VPLYEYRCKDCGHQFEKIQSFSAPDEKECPVCHGPVERLISASAIQFKGSGWYATDYASKPTSKKASADGDGKSADKSSGEKSTAPSSDKGTSSGSSAASTPSTTKSD